MFTLYVHSPWARCHLLRRSLQPFPVSAKVSAVWVNMHSLIQCNRHAEHVLILSCQQPPLHHNHWAPEWRALSHCKGKFNCSRVFKKRPQRFHPVIHVQTPCGTITAAFVCTAANIICSHVLYIYRHVQIATAVWPCRREGRWWSVTSTLGNWCAVL